MATGKGSTLPLVISISNAAQAGRGSPTRQSSANNKQKVKNNFISFGRIHIANCFLNLDLSLGLNPGFRNLIRPACPWD